MTVLRAIIIRCYSKVFKCNLIAFNRFNCLCRRVSMRQVKVSIWATVSCSLFMILLLYYWHHTTHEIIVQQDIKTTTRELVKGIPFRHMPLNKIFGLDGNFEDEADFFMEDTRIPYLIENPGCKIPFVIVDYRADVNKSKLRTPARCGKRAVVLTKNINSFDKVSVFIDMKIMKVYLKNRIFSYCCYEFMTTPAITGQSNNNSKKSSCIKIETNTITLHSDFLTVKCYGYTRANSTVLVYEDMYAFIKKLDIQKPENKIKKPKHSFNILILGIDTMSLGRFVQTMPRTLKFIKQNFWWTFRGYNKVGDNTFPNVMAALTGINLSNIYKKCSGKMDACNKFMVWSKFKQKGYVTAYGEDYLELPDTFSGKNAFKLPPTDHYLRPFFLDNERIGHNKSLVCAGKKSSGQHLLDYAFDFANTYRNESFFGMFWMNSYSHNVNSSPKKADRLFETFFNRIVYSGVTHNTFVILMSDHGVRFGEHRLTMESFYDDRLPSLFVWPPTLFKGIYSKQHRYALANQYRLVTPYDLFNTLIDIGQMTNDIKRINDSQGCPQCHSFFELVNRNRTCEDVGVHEKWCSCHKLYPLDKQDPLGLKAVEYVVQNISAIVQKIQTKPCRSCSKLSLEKVVRMHFYHDNKDEKKNKLLYYVVAFILSPGSMAYEATVAKGTDKFELVGPISIISVYRGRGKCVLERNDRVFCFCIKEATCGGS